MDTLKISADRADHYSFIARNMAAIASRMGALSTQFASVAPRTPSDDGWLDLLIASAQQLLTTAATLKTIEYVEPVQPEPEAPEAPETPAE
jgi:hypothetical protein